MVARIDNYVLLQNLWFFVGQNTFAWTTEYFQSKYIIDLFLTISLV